jgi:SAM-dependent methyltransferase
MSTARTFHDKWHENPDLAFRQTNTPGSDIQRWILRRNGWESLEGLREYLVGRPRVLDAGCGNGRVTALLASAAPADARVVGVDLTSWDVAAENLSDVPNAEFHERDLLGDLSGLGDFDLVYCQEVLHHTGDPARAFHNVAALLAPAGELAIYVYREKAPVREFTDDHVRRAMEGMPYEEAMRVSAGIAEIGRQLASLNTTITVRLPPLLQVLLERRARCRGQRRPELRLVPPAGLRSVPPRRGDRLVHGCGARGRSQARRRVRDHHPRPALTRRCALRPCCRPSHARSSVSSR